MIRLLGTPLIYPAAFIASCRATFPVASMADAFRRGASLTALADNAPYRICAARDSARVAARSQAQGPSGPMEVYVNDHVEPQAGLGRCRPPTLAPLRPSGSRADLLVIGFGRAPCRSRTPARHVEREGLSQLLRVSRLLPCREWYDEPSDVALGLRSPLGPSPSPLRRGAASFDNLSIQLVVPALDFCIHEL